LMSTILRSLAFATASWRSSAETNLVQFDTCAAATWQQVKAPSEVLGRVASGEFAGLGEHFIQIHRNWCQPLAVDVVSQLALYRLTLSSSHQVAADESLEGVWNFELMKDGERNRANTPQHGVRRV